jgi:hypothetical protein
MTAKLHDAAATFETGTGSLGTREQATRERANY